MGSYTYYALGLTIPTVILIHLLASPYTKVEESFNIQAINDILTHGLFLHDLHSQTEHLTANYDHFTFPGSVPRSFVAALGLAGAATPLRLLGLSGLQLQTAVRAILGLANAAALLIFGRAIHHAFGSVAANWYLLLQATQFHVIYYASRTLPNSFAFVLTTLGLRFYVMSAFGTRPRRERRARIALALTTVAGVMLRSELAILVAAQSLFLLVVDRHGLRNVVLPAGVLASSLALLTTVAVDSFFWQTFPLWPEWVAFRYNTIEGKSAEWGVSPWHFYFTSSLPKLMLNPLVFLVCIPNALAVRATRRFSISLLGPLLLFVAVYSILPHKEWRFVVYVVPGLTGVAAAGASWIWTRRGKNMIYGVLAAMLVVSVALSALASFGLLFVSSLNYPGGAALMRLHDVAAVSNVQAAKVHLDNLSCQTGVTRFLQHDHPAWTYDKTEDPIVDPGFWNRFDYILAEQPNAYGADWEAVGAVRAYGGVSLTEGESVWRVLAPASGDADSPLVAVLALLDEAEDWLRAHVTRGRWPRIVMRRRISILARRA